MHLTATHRLRLYTFRDHWAYVRATLTSDSIGHIASAVVLTYGVGVEYDRRPYLPHFRRRGYDWFPVVSIPKD